MATKILSDSEIDALCIYFRDADFPYFESLREALFVMYLSGCRLSEAFEIWRWTWISDFDFHLEPQKGNTLRLVTLTADCTAFRAAVVNQYNPFLNRTKYQLDYILLHIKQFNSIKVDNKFRLTYLYRYNYVKKRFGAGDSVSMIASDMGYTSNTTTQAYLDAQLVQDFDAPPLPVVVMGAIGVFIQPFNDLPSDSRLRYANNDVNNLADYGYLCSRSYADDFVSDNEGYRLITHADLAYIISVIGVGSSRQLAGSVPTWSSAAFNSHSNFGLTGVDCRGIGYQTARFAQQQFRANAYFWANANNTGGTASYLLLGQNHVSANINYITTLGFAGLFIVVDL